MPVVSTRWPGFGLFTHQRICASGLRALESREAAISRQNLRDRLLRLVRTSLVATRLVVGAAKIPMSQGGQVTYQTKNQEFQTIITERCT